MANEIDYISGDGVNIYYDIVDEWGNYDDFSVGWDDFYKNHRQGAIRFTGVAINQGASLNLAQLNLKLTTRDGNQPIYFRCWGIKETNTGSFTSNPFSRPRTNAYVDGQIDDFLDPGEWKTFSVASIVNEIVSQGGWSSGNALGFLILNNGTTQLQGDQFMRATDGGMMAIRISAEPNFYPTPKSVAAPTFPSPQNLGIRFVVPGNNVLTSPDTPEITRFTTKRRCDFIKEEGVITTQAGVEYLIAHGITGKPRAEIYFMSSNGSQRFRAPRVFPPVQQGADQVDGKVNVDSTYIRITTSVACNVYYRIFLDKII
jgi:hypothetical protein